MDWIVVPETMNVLAAQKSPRRIACPSGPMNRLYVVSTYLPSVIVVPRGAGGAAGWFCGTTCGASLTSVLHAPARPSDGPPSDGLEAGAKSSEKQPHDPLTTEPAQRRTTMRFIVPSLHFGP